MTNKTTEISTDSVFINGTEYIPKSKAIETVKSTTGLPFVIIRTYSAGVHMGYLVKKESTLAGMEVKLAESRRLWQWSGANTLSDLALNGTINSKDCKFTVAIPKIQLVAIEIIDVTVEGFNSLNSVAVWKTK